MKTAMDFKKWVLILLVAFSISATYGQDMNADYSKIQGEIVKKTCNAFGVDIPNNINVNKKRELIAFFNESLCEIASATKKPKPLQQYVGVYTALCGLPLLGDNEDNMTLKTHVSDFLDQAIAVCKKNGKKHDWANSIESEINVTFDKYKKKEESLQEEGTDKGKEKESKGKGALVNGSSSDVTGQGGKIKDQATKKDENAFGELARKLFILLSILIGVSIVGGGIVSFLYIRKKKNQPQAAIPPAPKTAPTQSQNQPQPQPVMTPKTVSPNNEPTQPDEILNSPTPAPPVPPLPVNGSAEWVVVGASVKGNGHIQTGMPCQDNHKYEQLGDGWGIAIVSDGAGSAKHSEIGSKVVSERGILHFKQLLEKEEWMKNNTLPTDIEWLQKSYNVLKNIRNEVALVAQKNNVDVRDLSATCLVVIYSPVGLLTVHVGDGRMGYENMSGIWKPIMTPHKGEEANQTIFLVSDFWSIPNYTLSGVLVPESVVIREPVRAFALMSDGCENTSWCCTAKNEETGKYYDRNLPFEGFFKPLKETIVSLYIDKVPEEERNERWYNFIESGTSGFVKEQDDKTMIYGVNLSSDK